MTPSRVCISAGAGNVASALAGGMPMCHGSGGLTAHAALGARRPGMNLLLGGTLVVLGLFFGSAAMSVFGLLPVWALGAFLAFAGLQHAALVRDLRGLALGVAVVAGVAGAITANLAVTAAIGLAAVHGAMPLARKARRMRSTEEPERVRAGGS